MEGYLEVKRNSNYLVSAPLTHYDISFVVYIYKILKSIAYSGDVDRAIRVMPITQIGHGDRWSGERWLDRKS